MYLQIEQNGHHDETMIVFPSTKVIRESSMKKIVLIKALSTVHPNIVIPPGFVCKYDTAPQKTWKNYRIREGSVSIQQDQTCSSQCSMLFIIQIYGWSISFLLYNHQGNLDFRKDQPVNRSRESVTTYWKEQEKQLVPYTMQY